MILEKMMKYSKLLYLPSNANQKLIFFTFQNFNRLMINLDYLNSHVLNICLMITIVLIYYPNIIFFSCVNVYYMCLILLKIIILLKDIVESYSI